MDLDKDNDETFDSYYEIIEKGSNKIEADQDSVTGQASEGLDGVDELEREAWRGFQWIMIELQIMKYLLKAFATSLFPTLTVSFHLTRHFFAGNPLT